MNGAYYTPFFCEENVWQLGKSVKEEFFYQYRVLFLTNRSSSIALMNQKAAPKDQFIFWDYHVILHNTSSKIIFDYDSRLGFETDFDFYFRNTFPPQVEIPEQYRTAIRSIELSTYVNHFHSDRNHMIQNGVKLQQFPEWPPILNKPSLTLVNLLDLDFEKFIENTWSVEEYSNQHKN